MMVPAPMFAVLAENTARFPEQGHTLIVGLFLLLLGLVMGIGVAGFVLVIYSLRKGKLAERGGGMPGIERDRRSASALRSEEHTSELQSQSNLVCRLLLEKKNHSA